MATHSGIARGTTGAASGADGPVLLATLDAPITLEAAEVAVDAAVESGLRLVIANVVELRPTPVSLLLGYDQVDAPELEQSLRAPAELCRSLGVSVERLRVKSPRPVTALIQLVDELEPSLVVLGCDAGRVPRRRYRKVVAALRALSRSLVWIA